ncbi:unnamed protein product, partial [Oikopleura dioica]
QRGFAYPCASMFSHNQLNARSNNAEFEFDFTTGRLLVTCVSPIKAGEQLFISYGARADDDLLLEYGFCVGSDGEFQQNRVVFSQGQIANACYNITGLTKSNFDEKIILSRKIFSSKEFSDSFFDFEAPDKHLSATKDLIGLKLITFIVWLLSDAKDETELFERTDFVRGMRFQTDKSKAKSWTNLKNYTYATIKELFAQNLKDLEARDKLGGSACRLGEMIQGSCKILREEGADICRHWLAKL